MTPSAATRRKLGELHPDLGVRVEHLILACPFRIGITSAWRSSERQAQLYAAYKAGRGNPANPPGTSKHERTQDNRPAAEAVDLAYSGDEARRWAHRHAPKFGLRFPIRREDWHAESNGRPYSPPQPKELDVDEKTLRKIIGEEIDKRVTILLRGETGGKPSGHPDHLKSLSERLGRIEKALGEGR